MIKNLQLALDLLGASGEQDACKHHLACSVRVQPDKNALGDSHEQATLRFQLLLKAGRCEGKIQFVVDRVHQGQFGMHRTLVIGFRFTGIPFSTTIFCSFHGACHKLVLAFASPPSHSNPPLVVTLQAY